MHELSLMESTLAIVFEEARRSQADKVASLRMKIGALSGVVPESLLFAFEALTEGTMAEGARLQIDRIPVACYCETCKSEFEPALYSFKCPSCGNPSVEIRRGREIEIVSIEVP